MSERNAWAVAFGVGTIAVLTTLGVAGLALIVGYYSWYLIALLVALFSIAGKYFHQASYLRTQRILSDRADELERLEGRAL